MPNDSTDFMIEEYEQIASAYFGLQDRVNEWFRLYITLVGLPLTVLAATIGSDIFSDGSADSVSIASLPEVVSGLLILVAMLGVLVTLTIVNTRIEMILYARTINLIRRYFAELERSKSSTDEKDDIRLADYLILPTTDTLPPFFEPWRAIFWQVLLVGFLDGILLGVAANSLFLSLIWATLAGILMLVLHFFIYWFSASRRDKEWSVYFPENLNAGNY